MKLFGRKKSVYQSSSTMKEVLHRLFQKKLAMLGLVIFGVEVLLAVLAPLIAPYDPLAMDFSAMLAKPSAAHLMGCDDMGRDILSRILYGARSSLGLGLLVVLCSTLVGTVIGAIVGYFGGIADAIIMRILEIFQSIPHVLTCIVLSVVFGTGFVNTLLALSISRAIGTVRLLRGSIMGMRHMEYLEAADALNCSKLRTILRHVLPNSFAPLIVYGTTGVASAIMNASTLSFIGLGILPPTPEWGAMISGSRKYFISYPHTVLFPGIAIAITVFALSILGDGLRDALDPKLKD